MPRLDWSPDGTALVTCVAGVLRRHDLAGGSTIVDGGDPAPILDARWDGDAIVAITTGGAIHGYRDGAMTIIDTAGTAITYASLAGDHYVAMTESIVFVATVRGELRWKLDMLRHNLGAMEDRTSATIAADGKHVAIGYETRAYANFSWERREGRGWLVIDTRRDRVIDRSWAASRRDPQPTQLAFDRSGRRLALATPELGPCIGAIRVGRDERYPRTHVGGARAVAIDDRGILAAYAYPSSVADAPRRLRVDYLEPDAKGPAAITIVDTLWLDPDLDDIVALAFDRASRRIACVDASGRIDVVPVP